MPPQATRSQTDAATNRAHGQSRPRNRARQRRPDRRAPAVPLYTCTADRVISRVAISLNQAEAERLGHEAAAIRGVGGDVETARGQSRTFAWRSLSEQLTARLLYSAACS